jgi:hypothetical protein
MVAHHFRLSQKEHPIESLDLDGSHYDMKYYFWYIKHALFLVRVLDTVRFCSAIHLHGFPSVVVDPDFIAFTLAPTWNDVTGSRLAPVRVSPWIYERSA